MMVNDDDEGAANMHYTTQDFWNLLIAFVIGSIGGMAQLLSKKDKRKITRFLIFADVGVSGFAGFMAMAGFRILVGLGVLNLSLVNLSNDAYSFVCGMAGWGGAYTLAKLEKPLDTLLEVKHKE